MSYTPFNWLPRQGQGLNKFTDQTTGQVLTLNSTPDSITQEGTPFSATRMNALEQGLGNVFDKPEQLTAAVAALFGFHSSTVPNDIFNLLSSAALHRTVNQPKYNEVTIDLSTAQVGDIINLPFNGVMTPHIVVNVGNPDTGLYDSSCNGVWLLMQELYGDATAWDSSGSNDYGSSDVNTSYLPNTVLPLYSTTIQNGIVQAKIPYVNGPGNTGSVDSGSNGLSTKLFLLSGYELGWTQSTFQYFPVDGAVLSYFSNLSETDSKRLAYSPSSVYSRNWWTRSPSTGVNWSAFVVSTSGGYSQDYNVSNSSGVSIRPAFIMPATFSATVYTDDGGNVYDAQEYYDQQGLYDVLGNLLLPLPGVQIETGSYVGTGTYGSSNPNSLTFGFEPKWVFIMCNKSDSDNTYNNLIFFEGNIGLYFDNASTGGSAIRPFRGLSSTTNNGEFTETGVTWYRQSAKLQCNVSQTDYNYLAIG